jgi:lipopolysaccharide/colanic/teichoic acid biosynthesis glycosyltransferase
MIFVQLLLDTSALVIALLTAFFWRQNWPFNLFLSQTQPLEVYLITLPVVAIVFIFVSYFVGLYKKEALSFNVLVQAKLAQAFFYCYITLTVFAYIIKYDYSRLITIIFAFLAFAFTYFFRWQMAELRHLKQNQVFAVLKSTKAGRKLAKELAVSYIASKNNFMAYQFFKRLIDILLGGILLLVSLPLWPVILILIRWESKGSELFRQKRIGYLEKPIYIFKFKTMKDRPVEEKAPTGPKDGRILRIGKLLRKYSLDELPQLLNVVKGDMTLVGPRPEMSFIVDKYQPWQKTRFLVKPGLTGLWQILGRKDLPLEDNLEYDMYYMNNQSLFLDFAIVLKTIPKVLCGSGAY